jgi:F-type H+-transporting ATPase subunit gamma
MAENDHRYRHLDSAVRRLDEKGQELDQHMRFLRQEEIIEEIEVILLSAESVAQK